MVYYLNGNDGESLNALRYWLVSQGHTVVFAIDMEEALPMLSNKDLTKLCFCLIDMCDCVMIPRGWEKTRLGKLEYEYAKAMGKEIHFESKQWSMMK